ncbi:MAG: amino acid permease [Bacteroidales bacterium]
MENNLNNIGFTNPDTDSGELHKFGYKQQLNRSMGGFSSFAISFSLISVLTGIFANFNFGFAQVGGSIVWSWLLVGFGQFLVSLVMADLSTHFPISGYGYQWTARLVNAHFGFFVGWFLLIQFITGFPGTSQAMAVTLSTMLGGESSGWTVSFITLGIITLVTLIHIFGIKIVSLVNNLGVYAELTGVLLLIAGMTAIWILSGAMNTENLFRSMNSISQNAAGFSSFALSLLLGAWCLTGFEAAADLAEETKSPRKYVPRAVISSQLSAALAGFLILILLVLNAGNIGNAQGKSNALISILENSIGTRATAATGMVVMLSIFACAVASMATATRLLFSMSRDNIFPFSSFLAKVNQKRQTPQIATIVIWLFSSIVILAFRRIEIITSVGAVAAYLGYAGIMLATIITKKDMNAFEGFTLGVWRKIIQFFSLIWTLLVVAALCIPETDIPGVEIKHLPFLMTAVAAASGVLFYLFSVRKKIKKGMAGPPRL